TAYGDDGLRELGPVCAQDRDTVARLHPAGPQCAHQAVRVLLDLGERAVPGLGDDRQSVGLAFGPERVEQASVGHRVQRLAIELGHAPPSTTGLPIYATASRSRATSSSAAYS